MKYEFSSAGRNYRHTINNNQLAILAKIIGNYQQGSFYYISDEEDPYYWNWGETVWLFTGLDGTYLL